MPVPLDKATRTLGTRLAQTIRKTGGAGGGFKEFLLCNLFWFAVCACFLLLLLYIISCLFLAYFFPAVPAASYYFTRFCFCLFVYFCMVLFCLGIRLSAGFFIVPHRSGGGECVPFAILSASSSQGVQGLFKQPHNHSRAWVQLVVVHFMLHIQSASLHKS